MKFPKKIIVVIWSLFISVIAVSCVTYTEEEIISAETENIALLDTIPPRSSRTAEWEFDILLFRSAFNSNHPVLKIREGDYYVRFNEMLDDLKNQINELADYEIGYTLAAIAASLDDAHSYVATNQLITIDDDMIYPVSFMWYDDGYYVTTTSLQYKDTFLCKLVAINGIEIQEIITRFEKIIPFENRYAQVLTCQTPIKARGALRLVGIIEDDEEVIEYTFVNRDGRAFTVPITPMIREHWAKEDQVTPFNSTDNPEWFRRGGVEDNYWYEYLPNEKIMYVRYASCSEMEEIGSYEFFQNVLVEIENSEVDKLVFDLRSNNGGILYDFDDFAKGLSCIEKINKNNSLFVLIDNYTYSSGVLAAARIKYFCENALLVGEPTYGAVNFYAGAISGTLPHSNISYKCSTVLFEGYPGYKANTLLPDIYITFTFDDRLNDYDRVFETVKGY